MSGCEEFGGGQDAGTAHMSVVHPQGNRIGSCFSRRLLTAQNAFRITGSGPDAGQAQKEEEDGELLHLQHFVAVVVVGECVVQMKKGGEPIIELVSYSKTNLISAGQQ